LLDRTFDDGSTTGILTSGTGVTVASYDQGYDGTNAINMTYSGTPGFYIPAIRFSLSEEIRNACINPGTTIGISFKAKLLNATDNNSEMSCDPSDEANCPEARLRINNLDDGGSINEWIEDLPLGFSSSWNPVSPLSYIRIR